MGVLSNAGAKATSSEEGERSDSNDPGHRVGASSASFSLDDFRCPDRFRSQHAGCRTQGRRCSWNSPDRSGDRLVSHGGPPHRPGRGDSHGVHCEAHSRAGSRAERLNLPWASTSSLPRPTPRLLGSPPPCCPPSDRLNSPFCSLSELIAWLHHSDIPVSLDEIALDLRRNPRAPAA